MSRPETPKSAHITNKALEKDPVILEALEVDEIKEAFEDPEAANRGHPKRPMILTHSVMVGLTLILLIALEAIVISKVSS
jgi:hypothetical protein